MTGPMKYTRAIFAFMIALALFLVCLDAFLVSRERRILYAEFNEQALNEFTLIETFVTEPLLQEEFTIVEQFMMQWGEKKGDIVELRAFSPQGLQLAEFKRPTTGNDTVKFRHSVHFRDKHLLNIEITKDLLPVISHIKQFWRQLIFKSLFITVALGIILWVILKSQLLRPLEAEIAKRKQAEENLQKAKDQLEVRVAKRTADLSTAIEDIHKEMLKKELAEQELSGEKEQLSVTLRSIGDGVITTDIDGNVVLLNKVAEQLTGWSQKEAAGQPVSKVFNIINEKTSKPCKSPVSKVLELGEVISLAKHTALIAKDGNQRIIADSGAPIRDKESRIIGVVLVFRDVTDQLKMEEELLKIEKLESVGVLAGGIAHDFNNILAGILGNIELSLLDANLKSETQIFLTKAKKASVRATDLTKQLLTFSKGGEPVKKTTSISEIIKDLAEFVLHGSNVTCHYHIPEDLWLVDIDKGQIGQVVQNIIINAKHAMPTGGTIAINCENKRSGNDENIPLPRENNYVIFTISDNGVGINEEEINKIFDPYYSTKDDGSGLGLAISHSIISKHGGHISVQSKLGEGTTFTIYLPASIQEQQKENKNEEIALDSSKAIIMVMDDEPMVRDVAKAMLTKLGHDVVLVQDGEEALNVYKEYSNTGTPIDIVIMDLTIPGGVGGKDAVKNILAIDSQAKVIVSSGYSNDPIMSNCKEYGFMSVVVKPFQLQDLMKAINQVQSLHLMQGGM